MTWFLFAATLVFGMVLSVKTLSALARWRDERRFWRALRAEQRRRRL
jgi:hypothetical protein